MNPILSIFSGEPRKIDPHDDEVAKYIDWNISYHQKKIDRLMDFKAKMKSDPTLRSAANELIGLGWTPDE